MSAEYSSSGAEIIAPGPVVCDSGGVVGCVLPRGSGGLDAHYEGADLAELAQQRPGGGHDVRRPGGRGTTRGQPDTLI